MRIIGHRGAAGLALENTLSSFRLARDLKVDYIELDVRVTKDNKVVVCHDATLSRVSRSQKALRSLTYAELKKIPLLNGEHVPLLENVLKITDTIPLIVEIKVKGQTELILKVLDKHPNTEVMVTSFHVEVINDIHKLRPDISLLLAEKVRPFSVIHTARRAHAGLNLSHWLLNPLTYYLARRNGMQLIVHTVDLRVEVWLLHILYPNIWLCTNHPERFVKRVIIESADE